MKFSKIKLHNVRYLSTFLLLCFVSCFFTVAESKEAFKRPFAGITNPTPENLPTYSGTCDDLYLITSFNNLLTQIYRHLDDDCLYLMPPNELSEKLGIEVYSLYDDKTDEPIASRFSELLHKPFTDFRSAIFLAKRSPSNKELEKMKGILLKDHFQRDKVNIERVGYEIYFSYAYLDNLPSPFVDDIPTQLPYPDRSYPNYVLCSILSDDILYSRGKKSTWLDSSETTYEWYGYVGELEFNNCNSGANNFRFSKPFYIVEENDE